MYSVSIQNHFLDNISENYRCDQRGNDMISSKDWQGSGWYRIMEPAGTEIAQQVVTNHHCNTGMDTVRVPTGGVLSHLKFKGWSIKFPYDFLARYILAKK